jgi:ABC-2 type transport system permease protein
MVPYDKTNRTAEVLLLSMDPRQLMIGKIIGLSVVAIIQMLVWTVGGMALGRGAVTLLSGNALDMPVSFLGWSGLFFAFGYLLYASLLGAVGAMAPSQHDDGQLAFLISLPQVLPLLFFTAFANAPSGPVATFLSLFPLTAPTAMPTRLAGSSVPAWQLLVSLALLVLTTAWVVNISARAFRSETLLSGAPIGLDRLKEWWSNHP